MSGSANRAKIDLSEFSTLRVRARNAWSIAPRASRHSNAPPVAFFGCGRLSSQGSAGGGAIELGEYLLAEQLAQPHQEVWWGLPTRNTLDHATSRLPKLLYERLDEIGLDVTVLCPSWAWPTPAALSAQL